MGNHGVPGEFLVCDRHYGCDTDVVVVADWSFERCYAMFHNESVHSAWSERFDPLLCR